ncbi:division/cell wall cluster transcriptional repressor MraZ [Dissulfurirhabdus thermomarina]|uniref:division/cell wall cluster transcriptional repressor MraZ n=1 Tax=Dissulfurirhabdus thermomarina TaxID=1765737 RepID=UPI0015E8C538|nr:division/cell wall cluster transcriptional repressor MraZ [Dissulfurirhabdus thermomarina]
MFRGRSTHSLDAKGRLSIPARFRDVLKAKYDGRLIVTNLPGCLAAYPYEEWRVLEEQFSRYRLARPEVLAFQRYFLAAAVECPLDGQGRILIPPALRDEAGFQKEVVLSGMLTYFEIWSRERLEAELSKARENFDQYSSVVANIGGFPEG